MKMDFLKPLFDEELNSQGEDVVIANSTFERCKILSGLEPETYELAFNEWLNEHQELLLDKADEILDMYDNRIRFEQLVQVHRSGNLIPFVGAGMSMPSDYPSWTSFLYMCCEESDIEADTLTEMLGHGHYEEAAELICQNMTSVVFNEKLEATFSRQKPIEGAINYLPTLFAAKHIITTNFDTVIERTFDAYDVSFDAGSVKSGKSLTEVARSITASPRVLIKLHGTCNEVANRVLLKSEYDLAYGDQGEVDTFFDRVIYRDSLLFLGASLNVDRTIQKMKSIAEQKGHEMLPRHYAFLELKDDQERVERKRELGQANIFPIWYSEGEHDSAIEALMFKLIKEVM